MAQTPKRPAPTRGMTGGPIGVNGVSMSMGVVLEEKEPELIGINGQRTYARIAREPIIAAGLHAIDSVVRSVEWDVVPASPDGDMESVTDEAKDEADWVRSMLIEEPGGASWPDFVSEAISFIEHGYSLFEIIYEMRDDGRIGIADLDPRAQETIYRWNRDLKTREIISVSQLDPETGRELVMPYEKLLHFVFKPRKRNPEGRSMLRAAWRPWKRKLRTEVLEDIGTERDLTGIPVMYIPSLAMANKAALDGYTKLVRDVRFNEQAGIVLPSDPWTNAKGEVIGTGQSYRLELLSSSNTRDPNIRARHEYLDAQMARLLLAEFLLLGGGAGAYSLSKDKTDFLSRSIKALLNTVANTLNAKVLTRLWALNGLDPELRPKVQPGDPAPEDLAALAQYVSTLAAAGARMFPDDRMEEDLRRRAGLPPLPADADAMLQDTMEGGDDAFGGGEEEAI